MNLDTILISLPIDIRNIKAWERFQWGHNGFPVTETDAISFETQRHRIAKLRLNHINTEQHGPIWHYPIVTLRKNELGWSVWLEGSLAKFYFGTNLFEFIEQDFESVITKLYTFLHLNGLEVERNDIYDAMMHKADISKILLVHPEIPLAKVLEYLSKIDFDMRNELHAKEYIDYRQGGKGLSVTWGTTRKKLLSIYDKFTELQHCLHKSEKEENILSFLNAHRSNLYNLLKYEECLHDKKRLNYVCNKVTGKKKKYYTLSEFWDIELAKKILLFRGEKLFTGADINMLLLGNHTQSQIQHELKIRYPHMQATRLCIIAHNTALAYEIGIKGMKKQLQADFSRSTQGRILQDVRFLMATMTRLPMQDVFTDFYTQLQTMRPIRSCADVLVDSTQRFFF